MRKPGNNKNQRTGEQQKTKNRRITRIKRITTTREPQEQENHEDHRDREPENVKKQNNNQGTRRTTKPKYQRTTRSTGTREPEDLKNYKNQRISEPENQSTITREPQSQDIMPDDTIQHIYARGQDTVARKWIRPAFLCMIVELGASFPASCA